MELKPIQLFQPTYEIDACLDEIRECLECGWTGLGFKTIQFEKAWSEYTGLTHSHFVASNTAGLQLALRVLKDEGKWMAGDEVITTPLTFISSNHMIVAEGLKPIFADIDESLCLDPISVAKCITSRTRAVMFVGMGGNAGQLNAIKKLCDTLGVSLILDAAHMAGTHLNGQHVGQGCAATVFSFQAVKNLPTADSGMVCFDSAMHDKQVRKLSWMGINRDTYSRSGTGGTYSWYYDVESVGYKAHGNSVMAAIGLVQLKVLDRDNARRRKLAKRYQEKLSSASGIEFIPVTKGCESSQHLVQIRVPAQYRDPLMASLAESKIFCGVHYRLNTHYSMYQYGLGKSPMAEKIEPELLSLPCHLRLSDEDIDRVCDQILSFFEKQRVQSKAA